MTSNTQKLQVQGARIPLSKQELQQRILQKLTAHGVSDPASATAEQMYHAVVYVLKDMILNDRAQFKKRIKAVKGKKVCYLCMEFLVGRSLKNNAINMGVYNDLAISSRITALRLMKFFPAKSIPDSATAVLAVSPPALWIP